MRLLHADAVIVGDGTSIRDGALLLDGDVVREVGPASDVVPRVGSVRVERVSGLLVPGLVNPHVHVELAGLRGKTPSGAGFVPWLRALQAARAEELEEERDAAIDAAIASMHEAGVVAVGEVTNTLVAAPRLGRRFLGTIFHEIFALDSIDGRARLDVDAPSTFGGMRRVLAPHALYSTHPDVVRAIADRASPLTIHLAEHAAERAFLRDGGGPLRLFYEQRGLTDLAARFPIPARDPIAYARALGLLRADAALVHLSDARPEELDLVAEANAVAVLCPRSNLAIETRYPPLLALRARGVPIAIGTDSLASAPSLDPLDDARALLDRTPEVPASLLVAAVTSVAARAIGWPSLGRIAVGRAPGVVHVAGALPGEIDPSAFLLRNLALPRRHVAAAKETP